MTDTEALVFVVDDDASLRTSLQDLLESVGLRVAACASAQEFLRHPPPEGPSCLVLDVRLPGLSGLELQQRLTAGDLALPIIFITGHGDIPMSVQAMKAGAVDFLPKPFRDQDLLDAVHQALARDRLARAQRAERAAPYKGRFLLCGRLKRCCATGYRRGLRHRWPHTGYPLEDRGVERGSVCSEAGQLGQSRS